MQRAPTLRAKFKINLNYFGFSLAHLLDLRYYSTCSAGVAEWQTRKTKDLVIALDRGSSSLLARTNKKSQ